MRVYVCIYICVYIYIYLYKYIYNRERQRKEIFFFFNYYNQDVAKE